MARSKFPTFVCRKSDNTELMRCCCGRCEAEKLEKLVSNRDRAIKRLVEALQSLKLNHAHNPEWPDYRPLGESYGWCGTCNAKVSLNEDLAREALESPEVMLVLGLGERE
jgi:hypothetical protein